MKKTFLTLLLLGPASIAFAQTMQSPNNPFLPDNGPVQAGSSVVSQPSLPSGEFVAPQSATLPVTVTAAPPPGPSMPIPRGMVVPSGSVAASVPSTTMPPVSSQLPTNGFLSVGSTPSVQLASPDPNTLPSAGFIPAGDSAQGFPAPVMLTPQSVQSNVQPNVQNYDQSSSQNFQPQNGVSFSQGNFNQPRNGTGQNGQAQVIQVPNPVQGYVSSGQPIYVTPQNTSPSQGYTMNGLALTPVPGSPPAVPSMGTVEFNEAMRKLMPMTPGMIRQFKDVYQDTQKEMARPAGGVPRPRSKALALTLKPGEDPPVLHLFPGNATAITFSDVTGAPWPVMDVTSGDPSAMEAHQAGEKGKSNIVIVSPKTNYAQAKNMIVTLVNYPVPIGFQIETGDSSVDYRIDIGLRTRGPNASQDIMTVNSLAPTNDRVMQAFVDGVPPKEAHKMKSSSPEIDAWSYQDMIYVRTSLEILSPAYVARSNKNVTGISVYTMVDCPVVLVSQGGRLTMVSITR